MGICKSTVDRTEETVAESKASHESTGFEDVKNIIADQIHNVAEALGEKTACQREQGGIAQCGKHASEWLGRSAEYVREFDFEQADARVREFVRQSPGYSLLIAGAVGLIIGTIFRRR